MHPLLSGTPPFSRNAVQNYCFFLNPPNIFYTFVPKQQNFHMKLMIYTKKFAILFLGWLLGVPLMVAGVLLFAADFLTGQKTNILLFTGLICIVAGITGYIWRMKRKSLY